MNRTSRRFSPVLPLLLTTALGVPCFVSVLARPALAAPGDVIGGVRMPKGAKPYAGANAAFSSLLGAVAKEKAVGKKAKPGAFEAYIWQGDDFREDRIKFTQTAVRSALTAAGFTLKDINENEFRNINVYEHFGSSDDPKAPIRPSVLRHETQWFVATNEAQGVSVVVGWVLADDAAMVGFQQVEFQAAKKPNALPAPLVSGPNVILVKDINDAMKGAPAPKPPAFPALSRKPGTVRGFCFDGAGRPIAGAEVAVYASAGGGFRTTHKARSNARGMYEVLLPAGIGEIAQVTSNVTYGGEKFELRLKPAGGEAKQFDVKAGHVENYVLQTAGEDGATLRVLDDVKTGIIEVTLTPQGRQLDGSAGRTLIFRYPADKPSSETYLNGVPVGRYKLTARLLDDGEALPLRAGHTFGFGSDGERELGPELLVEFKAGYTFSQANPGKSNRGVAYFEVTLEP